MIGVEGGLNSHIGFAQNNSFTVISEELPPFEYFDEDGLPTGISVDMAREAFEQIGVEAEFIIRQEGPRALERAKQGEVDAILSISYSPDRESFLTYPEGFVTESDDEDVEDFMWISEYVLFAHNENVSLFEDLSLKQVEREDLTVGVIEGVSYDDRFWELDIEVVEAANEEENFTNLVDGDVDLVLSDVNIGEVNARYYDLWDQIDSLNRTHFTKSYTMALVNESDHPKAGKVLNEFYDVLEEMRQVGTARNLFLELVRSF